MRLRIGILIVTLLAVVVTNVDVRADRLDGELNRQMPQIMEKLKAKYRNVGVLRFRVQEGAARESYASPLAGRIAASIENLLVIHGGDDESKALGVIHDAGRVAGRAKIGAWDTNRMERRKLFAQEYPLAWGDRKVVADAFVTGKVTLNKDRKKTTVSLECFDRASGMKSHSLGTITLDTDRFILRDLGHSFALSKRSKQNLLATKRDASLKDEDTNFVDEVDNQKGRQGSDTQKADDKTPKQGDRTKDGDTRAEPGNVGGVAIDMLVDDNPVTIREAQRQGDSVKWQVDSPVAKADIHFRLRNTSDRPLAVVLRVNGVSTNNEQKEDPENAAKWVIQPKKFVMIKGFYRGEAGAKVAKLLPFKVLVGEEARTVAEQLGDKKGLIDVDVFEEGPNRADEPLTSTKGLPPSQETQARSSYLGLRSALLKSSKLKSKVVVVSNDKPLTTKREIFVPDESASTEVPGLKTTDFKNPRLVSRITIRVMPGDPPVDQ